MKTLSWKYICEFKKKPPLYLNGCLKPRATPLKFRPPPTFKFAGLVTFKNSVIRMEFMQFDLFDTTTKDVFSATTYGEFAKRLKDSACSKCAELCQTRHNIVVDRGNPDTKIVAIGEAPGENEDLQGKAFVGRAGQLLDKIMESIGLDTNEDMLILNVVKCRPPKNRAPTPAEAQNCRPYLDRQLNFVKPSVIVLLG